jgi:hypothetical protein
VLKYGLKASDIRSVSLHSPIVRNPILFKIFLEFCHWTLEGNQHSYEFPDFTF